MSTNASLTWRCVAFPELTGQELYALLKLRVDVFVVEQQCPYPELDGQDEEALHVLGTSTEQLVAYARILPPHGDGPLHIGRVVVHPEHRGTGLGMEVMRVSLRMVRERYGAVPVALSAQSHLQRFYESLGFVRTSEEYVWDGIPHVDMLLNAAT